MSRKTTPVRSGTASPGKFGNTSYRAPAMGGFGSSTTSVLSFIGEPPDLTQISDSSIVVLLKNLSKKEEVTKAKALEALLVAMEAVESIEEALLTAWVRLYPRLSIDASARARRLAHTLQGVIGSKSGKKLARHMPRIVGPWLIGSFDNDRASARAAHESLLKVFKSDEKRKSPWKAYQEAILEFCITTVASESVYALSDERWVLPDDAEAKFARVMAMCALGVRHLLENLTEEETSALEGRYREFLGQKTLWGFAFHADPFLRRSTYRLLLVVLEKRAEWLEPNLEMVSTALIMKAAVKSQVASVNVYLEVLEALTKRFPEAWRLAKPSKKKSALAQFVAFAEKGSQVAPASYWDQVSNVFAILPTEILAENEEGAKSVITGILNGIKAGPEPRSHMMASWGCYWGVCYRFLELQLPWQGFDDLILQQSLFPAYEGYIVGGKPEDRYSISQDDAVAATVCGNGLVKLGRVKTDIGTRVLNEVWKKVECLVIDNVNTERTESVANTTTVRRCAVAWTKLVVGVLKQLPEDGAVYGAVVKSNVAVLGELIETLLATNGKAVGSAVFIEQLLSKVGAVLLQDEHMLETTSGFFNKFSDLLEPETVEYLLSAFVSYSTQVHDATAFREAWEKTVHALMMSALAKEKKENSIILLINYASSSLADRVSPVPELDAYIVNKMRATFLEKGAGNPWVLVESALNTAGNVISQDTTSKLLAELVENISLDGTEASTICKVLAAVAGTNPAKLLPFISSDHGKELVSKLLVLANSPNNEISSAAAGLRESIMTIMSKTSDDEGVERLTDVTIDNICASVQNPASDHLSISYLASKASGLIKETSKENATVLTERLLFSEELWESAISPFLREVKNISLAITNPLGGCIFLVRNELLLGDVNTSWDVDGYSTVLRMAMFTMRFIGALEGSAAILSSRTRAKLLHYILLVQEVVKDNLNIARTNDIWMGHSPEVERKILEFTSSTQRWVSQTLKSHGSGDNEHVIIAVKKLMELSGNESPASFYAARAFLVAMSDLSENDVYFRDLAVEWVGETEILESNGIFRSAAMFGSSFSALPHAKKELIWAGLISSLLGVPPDRAAAGGLQQLVLLNAALPSADEGVVSIPQPRAMNLIKHLLLWVDEENDEIELSPGLVVEIAKVLYNMLPIVKDIYGSHWQSAFDFVKSCWEACTPLEELHLPMVSVTLKLFQGLKSLVGENDDLDDTWVETKAELYACLINLLLQSGRLDDMHQPRSIVNTQIARQLRNIDVSLLKDPGAVYPLLGTQSRSVQKAAFDILHRYIPTVQEQISVDVALSDEVAGSLQLPPEILSMIIEAPELPDELDMDLASEMPTTIRGYLFSWILVFDHFENASFKVKSIYVDALKEGSYMALLLDFIATTLFSPYKRPFDAQKVTIQSYIPDTAEGALHDLRWLQTHLYYLSLRHTPSLAKSWWLDSARNRAIVLAVEAFTEKHMSPHLIDHELTAVSEWVREHTQDAENDMTVKVAKAAREVAASYPVDDQAMDILVRLPAIFPLRQVEVLGVRRIGIDEKRFKQMVLAAQAVVNFQSGSIIDALTLFRKNITLHFQGVSECAICYSILAVTPDRSLPGRACATCKNKFHSTCLLKWFKTSNSSSCPLCRTSFSFYS